MNKLRELFLLFPYIGNVPEGYTLIHKHTALNDEPPYKMCSFYGISSPYHLSLSVSIEQDSEWFDDESYVFYLLRSKDVQRFISLMNNLEREYLDDTYQLTVENSYEGPGNKLSSGQIEEIASTNKYSRMPKIKHMDVQPIIH
jgi:hypothetical protein